MLKTMKIGWLTIGENGISLTVFKDLFAFLTYIFWVSHYFYRLQNGE